MSTPNNLRYGNQDVLDEVEQQWYKLCAILVMKLNQAINKPLSAEVQITAAEIEQFSNLFPGDIPAILYRPQNDIIRLWIMAQREAQKTYDKQA